MSVPDPDSFSWIAKIGAGFAVLIAPVVWVGRQLNMKADKHEVSETFKKMNDELVLQRGYVAKLFDQVRENEQRAQDRHEKVMQAVYSRMEK